MNPYAAPHASCGGANREFPVQLTAFADTLLEPGERVVWMGQPSPWCRLLFRLPVAAVFGVLTLTVVRLVLPPEDFRLMLSMMLIAFAAALGMGTVLNLRAARGTLYLLTQRRAMILRSSAASPQQRSLILLPEDLAWSPKRRLFWDCDDARLAEELRRQTLLPQLAARLAHADAEVRRSVARAFTRLGRGAAPFLPNLLDALQDDDAVVRRYVAAAVGNAGDETARPYLERLRFDDNRRTAQAAMKASQKLSGCHATDN